MAGFGEFTQSADLIPVCLSVCLSEWGGQLSRLYYLLPPVSSDAIGQAAEQRGGNPDALVDVHQIFAGWWWWGWGGSTIKHGVYTHSSSSSSSLSGSAVRRSAHCHDFLHLRRHRDAGKKQKNGPTTRFF